MKPFHATIAAGLAAVVALAAFAIIDFDADGEVETPVAQEGTAERIGEEVGQQIDEVIDATQE